MAMDFNIELIMSKLKEKRKVFTSEMDFQFEIAWIIKKEYSNTKVRLEYCPSFDLNMHIDILVVMDNKWIPIELKYKTKGCTKKADDEIFNLKNHGAKARNCYLYLKDIQRIEKIKNKVSNFKEGYTIFITNELSYLKAPLRINSMYKAFSLEENTEKTGKLDWAKNTSDGTKKNCEESIVLNNIYRMNWLNYSKIDDTNTGTFMYLINKITK